MRSMNEVGVPVQLIAETRRPLAIEPGKPDRFDYEYRRNGTRNPFVIILLLFSLSNQPATLKTSLGVASQTY